MPVVTAEQPLFLGLRRISPIGGRLNGVSLHPTFLCFSFLEYLQGICFPSYQNTPLKFIYQLGE